MKEKSRASGGYGVNLENDDEILKINSPKNKVGGPYFVIFKETQERWAIVALKWDNQPRLGIRWFFGNGGNPFSTGYPIWLIIPPQLSLGILSTLPIEFKFRKVIEDFLSLGTFNSNILKTLKIKTNCISDIDRLYRDENFK